MKLVETTEAVEPSSITAQTPAVLADYLVSKQAKTYSKLSALELGDLRIPGLWSPSYSVASILILTPR